MKTKTLWTALILLISWSVANAQTPDSTIRIDASYCFSVKKPVILPPGRFRIDNACQNLYLVNEMRYTDYREAAELFSRSNKDSLYALLIKKYDAQIAQMEGSYNSLLNDYKESRKLCEQQLLQAKTAIDTVRLQLLDDANDNLKLANENLEQAKGYLKDANKSCRREKIWVGLGGLALGLVIGLLIN